MGMDLIEMQMDLEEEFEVDVFYEDDVDETVGEMFEKIVKALEAKGIAYDSDDVWRRMLVVIVDITGDDPTKITKETRVLDLRLD